jgi:predicted MFS family arabinose efflux permease
LPLVAAIVILSTFVALERRSSEPMLPLELFKSRLFSSAALVTFLLGFVMISVPFFTVQFFQDVEHLSAFDAGLRMLSFTLFFSIGAPIAGRLARRFGYALPISLGAGAAGIGLLLLAHISADSAFLDVGWRLAVIGSGFSLMLSPLSAAALSSVAPSRAGLASSVANMSRQVGTVVGIALLGALVQTRASNSAASKLTGLPGPTAHRLASTLGHGGAQVVTPGRLPTGWTTARLQGIGADAYVAGIHSAFVAGGAVLLFASLAAAVLIRSRRAAAEEPAGSAVAEAGALNELTTATESVTDELAGSVAKA